MISAKSMLLKMSRFVVRGFVVPPAIMLSIFVLCATSAQSQGLKVKDICRPKGQETNTLHGLGLVVGLRGTGDGDSLPKDRALARLMQLMGAPMSMTAQGQLDVSDVADARNVAIVLLSVEVPAVGAQPGDRLDVIVSAISAKSLEGGYLVSAPMVGPNVRDDRVYALATGRLEVEGVGTSTTARISRGAKMETTVRAPFHSEGKLTLIIDRDFADFNTAQAVADAINKAPVNLTSLAQNGGIGQGVSAGAKPAKAIDQLHVEIDIPESYQRDPVTYVDELLKAPITLSPKSNRVVINEREMIVVIGENVEIAPALIQHGNLRIDAVAGNGVGFVELDPSRPGGGNPKLKALADALNALDVSTEELIAIIKTLKRKGDLYGELVIE